MEPYKEKKRERRIRDRERMLRRAYRVAIRHWPEPDPAAYTNCPTSWDEVYSARWAYARRFSEHLKHCSCSLGCGNGRRIHGDPTWQEYRALLDAVEQLLEVGWLGCRVRQVGTMTRLPRV